MKLATVNDVANVLKVKKSTLYAWVNQGAIPSYKLNGLIRFEMDEIEEWVRCSKTMADKSGTLIARSNKTHQDIDAIVQNAIDSVRGIGSKTGEKR
jgi:excisionase family DNA binding protein